MIPDLSKRTCSHMLTADGLSLPQSVRQGARAVVPAASTDIVGTVGIPSHQAGSPDSNDNEEGVHATHKVCALENLSDAICNLLCTSFYPSITH